jgi:DNA-directed RNA polymerase subunit RPC12/RpoP
MTVANLTKVGDRIICSDCEEQSDIPRNEQNYNTIRCQCGQVLFDAVRARPVEPEQGGGR